MQHCPFPLSGGLEASDAGCTTVCTERHTDLSQQTGGGDDLVPATLALRLSYLLFPLPTPGSHSNGFTSSLDLKEVTIPLQQLLHTIVWVEVGGMFAPQVSQPERTRDV